MRSRAPEAQTTDRVVMVRPAAFANNPQTRHTNRFQRTPARNGAIATAHHGDAAMAAAHHGDAAMAAAHHGDAAMAAAHHGDAAIASAAQAEFDRLAFELSDAGVDVRVFAGRSEPACPDEVFPNNWFSTHADGQIVLYPMLAANRRAERRADIVEALTADSAAATRLVDLTPLEHDGLIVEGTGSLVLDRTARVAYACRSPRTHDDAVHAFAERLGYEAVLFDALDAHGGPIYHTNVMMSVGATFALVCTAALDETDRERVIAQLEKANKGVIKIGYDELAQFVGNLLELRGRRGPVIALSSRALEALRPANRRALESRGELRAVDVGTIETHGGGSVRCMLAEDHLPRAPGTEPASEDGAGDLLPREPGAP